MQTYDVLQQILARHPGTVLDGKAKAEASVARSLNHAPSPPRPPGETAASVAPGRDRGGSGGLEEVIAERLWQHGNVKDTFLFYDVLNTGKLSPEEFRMVRSSLEPVFRTDGALTFHCLR